MVNLYTVIYCWGGLILVANAYFAYKTTDYHREIKQLLKFLDDDGKA